MEVRLMNDLSTKLPEISFLVTDNNGHKTRVVVRTEVEEIKLRYQNEMIVEYFCLLTKRPPKDWIEIEAEICRIRNISIICL